MIQIGFVLFHLVMTILIPAINLDQKSQLIPDWITNKSKFQPKLIQSPMLTKLASTVMALYVALFKEPHLMEMAALPPFVRSGSLGIWMF